jgi:hypothetical protein
MAMGIFNDLFVFTTLIRLISAILELSEQETY